MCPLDELWEIIDQIVLHLLCLLPRLSSQSSRVRKQNNQNNAHKHTVSQSPLLLNKCLVSVGWNISLDLDLPVLFDL